MCEVVQGPVGLEMRQMALKGMLCKRWVDHIAKWEGVGLDQAWQLKERLLKAVQSVLPEVEVAAGETVRGRDGVLQALDEEEQQFVEDAVQRALLDLWFGCDEDEKRRAVALWGPRRQPPRY